MTKHKFAPIIHTFKSAEAGIMVNGYLIETSDHIVAVDSALIESAARELRKQFDSLGTSVATSKAAMCGHLKTGHMKRRSGQGFLLLQSLIKQQTFRFAVRMQPA